MQNTIGKFSGPFTIISMTILVLYCVFFHFDFTVTFTSVKVPTKACVFPENKLVALQHRREASPKKKKVAKKVGLRKISQYDGVESLWCSRHTGYYGIAIKSIIYIYIYVYISYVFDILNKHQVACQASTDSTTAFPVNGYQLSQLSTNMTICI